jgi:uncharacterized phiE125 gp8 family phage protein
MKPRAAGKLAALPLSEASTMQLITPPVGPVVPLPDLRAHLRVDGTEEDALILSLEAAAVAYLDGWGGVLGRAIKTQTWRMEVDHWGQFLLPLPDVSAVAVTYLDADGNEQPATSVEVRQDAGGTVVAIDGPDADRIFINMTAAMTSRYLPRVEMIVKMLVAHWFDDRAPGETPAAASALIGSVRLVNV